MALTGVVGGCLTGVLGFNLRDGTEGGSFPVGGRALEGDDFSHGLGGEGVRGLGAALDCVPVPFLTGAVASESTEVSRSDASDLGDGGSGGAIPGPMDLSGAGGVLGAELGRVAEARSRLIMGTGARLGFFL